MLELACFITVPAHPHATSVAVYPALFISISNESVRLMKIGSEERVIALLLEMYTEISGNFCNQDHLKMYFESWF